MGGKVKRLMFAVGVGPPPSGVLLLHAIHTCQSSLGRHLKKKKIPTEVILHKDGQSRKTSLTSRHGCFEINSTVWQKLDWLVFFISIGFSCTLRYSITLVKNKTWKALVDVE